MTHDVTLSQAVAAEIRAEMGRQQKSGRAVAEAMGVSHIYLSRRLTGKVSLTLADLEKVAAALGVPASTFLPSPATAAAA
ncbi:helix-turn-helix transcriptional regulator [Micromonospora sp. WMMD1082]|uniref:helix-turn-helix domain-containing protein n=1 Tax=Micromonospora sp. WMMD1082 TaxID=3016104 RepID=UPI002416693E|nr:helix-turn-helix transcriptional regulator [Micromonospora sp. WMMD1082]MDG4796172.1 helix-turn-helix transcriptional regulator [Micromonospora sp. WMMD1082]